MSVSTRPALSSAAGTFAAFRHRNYRLWFAGQLISLIGTWMQAIAQGYLVYTLTRSAAYLGYVEFMSGLPASLLMIYGGLIADRVPRRILLVATQSAKMALALVLGALVFLGWVRPWHILVLAFLLGVANGFEGPARKSVAVDLVPRGDLTNAITFSDAMFYLSAIVGPAVGAAVYSLIAPSWCFTLNGVSFLAVIAALLMMRIQPTPASSPRISASSAIAQGLRYVRGNRLVQTLLTSELLLSIAGLGPMVLMPAWATKILGGDVTTNGRLLSARALGAVAGALFIAAVASRGNRGKVWTLGSLVIPLATAAFALSRHLGVSLLFLGLAGFSYVSMETNNSAILQSALPDELRGRVTSLYVLMYTGGEPLGALAIGLLAGRMGEAFTVLVCAASLVLFSALILLFRPEMRAVE